MTALLYFTRVRLRAEASLASLRKLLVPERTDARADAAHRLVWSLLGDHPDRARDFLWRESEPGTFYILSARPPRDASGLFEVAAPKPFVPEFVAGDLLRFSLRANATKAAFVRGGRGARHDVVMHALKLVSPGERAEARRQAVQREGRAWLAAQGVRAGFSLLEQENSVRVMSYRVARVPRARGRPASLGILDLEGTLRVEDPSVFCEALGKGFGRAKAFGCGLMLVRRC